MHILLRPIGAVIQYMLNMLCVEGGKEIFHPSGKKAEAYFIYLDVTNESFMLDFFQSMPSNAGVVLRMPLRRLSAMIHLTRASSTSK